MDNPRLAALLRQLRLPAIGRSLSIGAGFYQEAPLLTQIFPNWHHYAIDINHYPTLTVVADGQFLPFAPSTFDFILIRHPDVETKANRWRIIFESALSYVTPNGGMMITCYTYMEAQLIQTWTAPDQVFGLDVLPPPDLVGHDCYGNLYNFLIKF